MRIRLPLSFVKISWYVDTLKEVISVKLKMKFYLGNERKRIIFKNVYPYLKNIKNIFLYNLN